jgi:hypothetical protein
LRLKFLRFVSGLFFRHHLLSITWPALFSGSFFPQERVFNNFPASLFGLFRFVFHQRRFIFSNFSALFFKKGILFLFLASNSTAFKQLTTGYHASRQKSSKIARSLVPWLEPCILPASSEPGTQSQSF